MGKTISLPDMAKMYCISTDKIEGYAVEGKIPSHRHPVTGEVIFTDSDLFTIDRSRLLSGLPLRAETFPTI